jgi:hypothetical protein
MRDSLYATHPLAMQYVSLTTLPITHYIIFPYNLQFSPRNKCCNISLFVVQQLALFTHIIAESISTLQIMRNTKKLSRTTFLSFLLALCLTFFGCRAATPQKNTDIHISTWAITATEFKIVGENDVKNIKIHWEQLRDIDMYKVYRDGKLIGQAKGDVYDDYDLEVNKIYTYHVDAYKDGQKISTSSSQQGRTFTVAGPVFVYDNSNGQNNFNKPNGILIGNEYYWYSVRSSQKDVDGKTVRGRAIYEMVSPNGFDNWTRRELDFYPNANFEGIAVVYNKITEKVVIAAHLEDQGGYVAAKLYLAQITPKGDIEVTFSDRPLGYESRDQSIFIDEDNTAYILSATNMNEDINIYKLDEQWRKPITLVNTVFKGQHRETPSIIKKDNAYYFFSSKASGWYPSQAMYATTLDLAGDWSQLKEIGNNSTFGTQSTGITKYGTERSTYGMHGYQWGAQYIHKKPEGNFSRLLIVNFKAGYASMEYYSTLEYHEKHGLIPVQAGRNLTIGKKVSATSADNDHREPSTITDGADLTSSDFFKAGSYPYSLTIDMEEAAKIAEITFSTKLVGGSETAYKYTIEASLDGKNYRTIVNNMENWQVGFKITKIEDQSPYQYIRLNVHNIVNVHNNNTAEWADGVVEITAFGSYL